jgi:uncharacterized membrane protein
LAKLVETGLGWVWFVILAVWGGTANYISRVRKEGMKFSTVELIGEWSISGFVGVITALICMEMGVSDMLTYALVGIAGHAGGRAIFILENLYFAKIGKRD